MADTQPSYPLPKKSINSDVRKLKLSSVHSGVHPSLYILLKCKKLVKATEFASKTLNVGQKALC